MLALLRQRLWRGGGRVRRALRPHRLRRAYFEFVKADIDVEQEILEQHPLYRVLNRRANPHETARAFRKRLAANVLLSKKGAFIAESDPARRSWRLRGPFCETWPINHVVADPASGPVDGSADRSPTRPDQVHSRRASPTMSGHVGEGHVDQGDFARASEISTDLGTDICALLARTIATLCDGQIREVEASGRFAHLGGDLAGKERVGLGRPLTGRTCRHVCRAARTSKRRRPR